MRWALALLLTLAVSGPLAAQDGPPAGAEYRISVLTAGPGKEVWELWGHNMIRVRNDRTGEDLVYNWGMFSFAQEGFVTRFLMGRMNYWMAAEETARTLWLYRRRDRTMIEQLLDLTPAQRVELVTFLHWNAEEANRYYRYDYYVDNCSTRLRDALDQALGGALRRATLGAESGTTFRNETRRLSAHEFPLYTGLMLGLGPFTDRPLDRWDEMFLPGKVTERLRELRMPGADGATIPLVALEDTLYLSTSFPEHVPAPRKIPLYLGLGLLVAASLLGAAWSGRKWIFLAVGGLVALVTGLGGSLLLFLMGFTDHSVTYGNENAFLLSFLALLLAAVLRPAIHGREGARRLASALALAIMGIALCAVLIKVTPFGRQDDWELIALLLPIDLALGLGTLLALRGPSWRPPRG
jgi:hypothetical protein